MSGEQNTIDSAGTPLAEGQTVSQPIDTCMPNVWGEGALFAFSGLDGETQSRSGFVASFGETPFDLLIHTPLRRVLSIRTKTACSVRAATGDVLAVATNEGPLQLVFSSWHTLLGRLPNGVVPSLALEKPTAGRATRQRMEGQTWTTTENRGDEDVIVLAVDGPWFALSYGERVEGAQGRARQGLQLARAEGLDAIMAERLAIYDDLPTLSTKERTRLLRKCVSVMKVNTLAAEGAIEQMWSTPDRVPHKHMWLWDSVFHTFGMNLIAPDVAQQFLVSVLEMARDDGMVPHCMHVDGEISNITQPPLLAWGIWRHYQLTGDRACLSYALPKLEAYLNWNLRRRDQDRNGLLEWHIEGNALCRSGESGMDNSPRFDEAIPLDAVDFSTFQAQDMACVARIAAELGQGREAGMWRQRAHWMARRIHQHLWDDEVGFYFDRRHDGHLSLVLAASGFTPLLLADLPAVRLRRLLEHLDDPTTFGAPFPVPSVALNDANWSTDMWRGATWVNLNALIIEGLRRHGATDPARQLAERTVEQVGRYYEQYGVLFEFYDASDRLSPVDCDRKGKRRPPYDIRRKMDSIRDYHWTAALVAWLLLEDQRHRDPRSTPISETIGAQ